MKDLNGATLWARKTLNSEIFYNKPDKWFKIWFYIVNKVYHSDNTKHKRGENFFRYEWIMLATKSSQAQVKHCIEYLKEQFMIKTHKKPHGFIIEVLNYNTYQSLDTYKSHTKRKTKGTQKPHYINKNEISMKEECNTTRFPIEGDAYKITRYFLKTLGNINQAIRKKYETYSPKEIENLIQRWCDSTDKLIRIDQATPDDIYKIIDWMAKDDFWSTVTQSTASLRRNYPKIYAKVNKESERSGMSIADMVREKKRKREGVI